MALNQPDFWFLNASPGMSAMPRHCRQRALAGSPGGKNRPAQCTSPKLWRVFWPCLLGLACLTTTLLMEGRGSCDFFPSDAQLASRTSTEAEASSSSPVQNAAVSVLPWNTPLAQAAQVPAGPLPSKTTSPEATSKAASDTSEPPVAEDWASPASGPHALGRNEWIS